MAFRHDVWMAMLRHLAMLLNDEARARCMALPGTIVGDIALRAWRRTDWAPMVSVGNLADVVEAYRDEDATAVQRCISDLERFGFHEWTLQIAEQHGKHPNWIREALKNAQERWDTPSPVPFLPDDDFLIERLALAGIADPAAVYFRHLRPEAA